MQKRLSALTRNINIVQQTEGDPLISGIAYDSRNVSKNFLFIALRGLHVDGHDYIERAVDAGAAAVLYSDPDFPPIEGTSFIRTRDTRTAMAGIAEAFYDNPASRLVTAGVTGTDGKTSTVYYIDQLIELCGFESGFISTAACKTAGVIDKNPYRQSTPEAVEINMLLSQMLENGKTHAVIEATSHGLSDKNNRLGGISFDSAVFTNLSHEHLEFHGTVEQYRDDKANLFRRLKTEPPGFGVVNLDDENSHYFIEAADGKVYTCSLKDSSADFFADEISSDITGSDFTLRIKAGLFGRSGPAAIRARINLPGLFNVENILEAFAAVYGLTGAEPEKLCRRLPEISAVKGRMRIIECGQPFTALIDYAHTPGSFMRLFPDVRSRTEGKLIAVFGSAGERDVEKRAEQGAIAARYSDVLVITDEDPRGEVPMSIIEEIAGGALSADRGTAGLSPLIKDKNLLMIPDRKSAFAAAFDIATEGDTVVMLGKGHESTIIYADGPIPWDEEAAAVELLRERFS